MTEPTGEKFQASPELGFAFGRISIDTVLDCLTAPELRDDQEAGEVALDMDVLRYYFENGVRLDFWDSYVNAKKEARKTKDNLALPKEVHEKYQEISEIIYAAHLNYVDEEKAAINALLNRYPGVVAQNQEGNIKLVSVDTLHVPLTDTEATLRHSPVRQVVSWSNETQTELNEPTSLFIDMTALPEGFSQNLNRYRILYDITLND